MTDEVSKPVDFDYLANPTTKTDEEVWCKIGPKGDLQVFNWEFVEKVATEFDQIPEGGPKNNAQIICKLAVLIREQTIKNCSEVLSKYAESSALANVVVLRDPLEEA